MNRKSFAKKMLSKVIFQWKTRSAKNIPYKKLMNTFRERRIQKIKQGVLFQIVIIN